MICFMADSREAPHAVGRGAGKNRPNYFGAKGGMSRQ